MRMRARHGEKKGSEEKERHERFVSLGIDLGERESVATVLSPAGDVIRTFSFGMDEDSYRSFGELVPKEARLAFEATGMAYPAWRALGYEDIRVAHLTELAWIVKSRRKSDRIDSLKIAKLHLVGMLPESNLLTREEQIRRDLLIQRVKLGAEIGKLKSSILQLLRYALIMLREVRE